MNTEEDELEQTEELPTTPYCQLLRKYYKQALSDDAYRFFDDKTFYLETLWRCCPEKLFVPAVEIWTKALVQGIDPLDIFLLGWHTGRFLLDMERQAEASIKGKCHRTGIGTKEKKTVDARFRKIFNRLKDKNAEKTTLNRLLQREFGIKDINHPNPELNSYRLKYYRAKKELEREEYGEEEFPEDYREFLTQYLDFLIRHTWIANYVPEKDLIIRGWERFPYRNRTRIEEFIHEKADEQLRLLAIQEKLKKREEKRKGKHLKNAAKDQEKKPDEK